MLKHSVSHITSATASSITVIPNSSPHPSRMPDMPQIPRVEARVVHHGGVPVTHTGRRRRETVKLAATAAQSIAPVDLTGGDVPRVELHGGDAEVDGAAARGGRRVCRPRRRPRANRRHRMRRLQHPHRRHRTHHIRRTSPPDASTDATSPCAPHSPMSRRKPVRRAPLPHHDQSVEAPPARRMRRAPHAANSRCPAQHAMRPAVCGTAPRAVPT